MQKINLLNKRFGYLTVVAQMSSGPRGQRWLCRCDCGTVRENVYTSELKYGKRTSCGCKRGFQTESNKPASARPPKSAKSVIKQYKKSTHYRSNKRRQFSWEITPEQEEQLMIAIEKAPCAYCGITAKERGVLHGLDRIDSSIPIYTMSNVVVCCQMCNIAKFTHTVEEFKKWIIRAYTHLQGENNEINT